MKNTPIAHYDLIEADIYLYFPLVIFAITAIFMGVFVVLTWRSDNKDIPSWKTFWNSVELLWIVLAFISLPLAILKTYNIQSPSVIAKHENSVMSLMQDANQIAKIPQSNQSIFTSH